MDWLEFAAKSEWPAVAAYALWTLRRPLSQMIGRVNPTKVDAWGLKAEFERILDKVDALAPAEAPKSEIEAKKPVTMAFDAAPQLDFREDMVSFLHTPALQKSPEVTILNAWTTLEIAVRKKAAAEGMPLLVRAAPGSDQWLAFVGRLGFTSDEIAAIQELRTLRNKVAHSVGVELAETDARRFAELVSRLLSKL